jgi:PRC-barrel domain
MQHAGYCEENLRSCAKFRVLGGSRLKPTEALAAKARHQGEAHQAQKAMHKLSDCEAEPIDLLPCLECVEVSQRARSLAMLSRIFGLFAAVVIASATVQAQSPGKVDLEVASALIGAAVFAADDEVVGHVFELVVDDDAQPQALRISTGALIGFGARTVEVPKGAFRIDGTRVVVDMSAEAVSLLPGRFEQPDPQGLRLGQR